MTKREQKDIEEITRTFVSHDQAVSEVISTASQEDIKAVCELLFRGYYPARDPEGRSLRDHTKKIWEDLMTMTGGNSQ